MTSAFSQAVHGSGEDFKTEEARVVHTSPQALHHECCPKGFQREKAVEDPVTENFSLQTFLSGPHSDDLFLSRSGSAKSILSLSTARGRYETRCGDSIDLMMQESASRLSAVRAGEIFERLESNALREQHPNYGDFLKETSLSRLRPESSKRELDVEGLLLGWPLWGTQERPAAGRDSQKVLLDTAKEVLNTALEHHDVIEVRYAPLWKLDPSLMVDENGYGVEQTMKDAHHAFVFEKVRASVDGSDYWVLHQSWQSGYGLEFTHAQWKAPPCAPDAEYSDREDFYEDYLACTRGFARLPIDEKIKFDAHMKKEHEGRGAYVKKYMTSFAPVHRRWGGGRLIPRVAVQYYLEELPAVVASWASGIQQSLWSAAKGWNNLRPDNPNAWWHVRNAVPVLLELVPRETFAGDPKKAACFDLLLAFRDQMAAWGSEVCEDENRFTDKIRVFLDERSTTFKVDYGLFPEIKNEVWGEAKKGAVTVSDSLKELVGSPGASMLPGMLFLAFFDRVDE